jgi:hypothetical protein
MGITLSEAPLCCQTDLFNACFFKQAFFYGQKGEWLAR